MAAVDCYNWVFGEDLLSPKELFAGKNHNGAILGLIIDCGGIVGNIFNFDGFAPDQ
jgi:hypothetical protein